MTPAVTIVEVRPRPADVAVFHLPGGSMAWIYHPVDGDSFATRPAVDDGEYLPVIGTAPGDRDLLGWGARIVTYGSLGGIRNGHHRRDRTVWHEAARLVRRGGVVYVEHEQQDWYGRPIWVAVRVRREEGQQ